MAALEPLHATDQMLESRSWSEDFWIPISREKGSGFSFETSVFTNGSHDLWIADVSLIRTLEAGVYFLLITYET